MAPGKRRLNSSTTRHSSSTSPTPPPLDEPEHSLPQMAGSNTGPLIKKGVRGLALGLELEKATRGGRKVPLNFPDEKTKPVGTWAPNFNSELGRWVRTYIDPSLDSWEEVPDVDKIHLEHLILEKFDVDIKRANVAAEIREFMKCRYNNWRYRLHKHYKKYKPHSVRNTPKNLSQDKWERLCLRFNTEKFQKRSMINIGNRANLKCKHFTGSKSFVQVRYEKRNCETGEELNRIDFFKETYFDPCMGAWSCDKAEERYKAMIALQSQPILEGATPMTPDEICDEVLGKKSGYIRGLGHGEKPAPSTTSSRASRFMVEEANKTAEEAELRAQQAVKRAEEAEKKVVELSERFNGVESLVRSFVAQSQPP